MARRIDRIAALMETWEPRLKSAFLSAVKDLRDRVDVRGLTALLKAGDVEGAIRFVGLDPVAFRPVALAIEQAFEAGGRDAMEGIGLRIAPLFDVRAPTADQWLRGHTTDLIRQITEDQRQVIRTILAPLRSGLDPMLTGETPQKLALDLVGRLNRATGHREGGVLGLDSQKVEWASNYADELASGDPKALTRRLRSRNFDRTVEKAIREGRSIPPEMQAKMVAAYRNRALALRARTIAENEASTALHAAQAEAWEQAIRRGAVEEGQVRRFWLTSQDERVRRSHRLIPGMNKDGVGLHQPFQTPHGPTMQPGWSFEPGCRCRVRVRVVETVV